MIGVGEKTHRWILGLHHGFFGHEKLGLQADDLRRAVTLTMAAMGWQNHGHDTGTGKPMGFFSMGKHGKTLENMGKYGKSWKCTYYCKTSF